MKRSNCIELIVLLIIGLSAKPTNSSQVLRPRGVSLSKASLYDAERDFTCLDGSGSIPFRYINDDYCDCEDGSDEPGTSACPNGSFFCSNLGHKGLTVPSSRVNDGICDCCDGSDEYSSGANCPNTCRLLGAAAREDAERKWQLENQGFATKLQYIEQAKTSKKSRVERSAALKAEQVEAEALRSEKEDVKKTAEEAEKEVLEKYRAAEEADRKSREEQDRNAREADATAAFEKLDTSQDAKLQVVEIQAHLMFDQNRDGVVSIEEAKFFLHSEEEMGKEEFLTTGWMLMKPYFMMQNGAFKAPKVAAPSSEPEKPDSQHETEHEEEIEPEEPLEEHEEEEEEEEPPKEETQTTVTQAQQYDPETQVLIDAANLAREAFDAADKRVREIERELNQLQDSTSKDYGPDDAFLALEGHCYDYSDREYTYRLCPFDNTSQRPKHGGSETRLGAWSHWEGSGDNKYSQMVYDKGVQCWNGPQRSAKVIVSCGVDNQLTAASEPNRCEYEIKFSTPAACNQPPGKPQDYLDMHDEL